MENLSDKTIINIFCSSSVIEIVSYEIKYTLPIFIDEVDNIHKSVDASGSTSMADVMYMVSGLVDLHKVVEDDITYIINSLPGVNKTVCIWGTIDSINVSSEVVDILNKISYIFVESIIYSYPIEYTCAIDSDAIWFSSIEAPGLCTRIDYQTDGSIFGRFNKCLGIVNYHEVIMGDLEEYIYFLHRARATIKFTNGSANSITTRRLKKVISDLYESYNDPTLMYLPSLLHT